MLGLGSVRDREDEVPSSPLDKNRGREGMGSRFKHTVMRYLTETAVPSKCVRTSEREGSLSNWEAFRRLCWKRWKLYKSL